MTRLEDIIATAQVFAGSLTDAQRSILERLCVPSDTALCDPLRDGLTPEDCYDSFVCAAAWMALSGLGGAQNLSGVESFTAGTLSVKHSPGASNCLAMQAEVMMAPYLKHGCFDFRRV